MAATGATLALLAAAITALVGNTLACDGFKVKNMQMKPCGGKWNIIEFKDMKPELTDRCTGTATGCLISNRTIDAIQFSYVVKKDGMVMTEGETEGCEFLKEHKDNEFTRPFLDVMNFPEECPIPQGQICGNGKETSLAKYRGAMMGYVGKYTVDIRLSFPDGEEACSQISYDFASPMGGIF